MTEFFFFYPMIVKNCFVRSSRMKLQGARVMLRQGAYPDASTYSLINEASITDLNSRLDEPITSQNFRSNFVVKGATAYEEDKWDWMKIGNVILRNIKPCTRCILTTVDPETGTKNAKAEPLKTLKRYVKNSPSLFLTYIFANKS